MIFHRSRRSGIMMIEMLVVLVLFGVVVAAAGRLFVTSMRAINHAPRAQNQIYQVSQMLAALRADVWSAGEIGSEGDNIWSVKSAGGPDVKWNFAPDGMVTRTSGPDTQLWRLDRPLRASSDPAGLLLRDDRTELLCLSQIKLSRRAER